MAISLIADVRDPSALLSSESPVWPEDDYEQCFLASGDSWFSLSQVHSYNLLFGLRFNRSTLIVNCTDRAIDLRRIFEWRTDHAFESLLGPGSAVRWTGVLVSGGGDDMLSALDHLLIEFPADTEIDTVNVAQLIDPDNWAAFEAYLRQNFSDLIALRDADGSPNRGVPIFAHTYAYATPRVVEEGALSFPATGSWLSSKMAEKNIPETLWIPLSEALNDKLAHVLMTLDLPGFHVIDTRRVLVPARLGTSGMDGDWDNETHPSRTGYNKLAREWDERVEKVMQNSMIAE